MNEFWLAGFWEGEGGFYHYNSTAGHRFSTQCSQNDEALLITIQTFLNQRGISSSLKAPGTRDKCWRLTLGNVAAADGLYHLIRPHMQSQVKIAQADGWHDEFVRVTIEPKKHGPKRVLPCLEIGR